MKLTTTKALPYRHVLVFGPPKVGKSELVSELAMKHELDWHDGESGSSVLYKLPQEAQERVNLFRYPDSASNPILVDTWNKIMKGAKGEICHAHGKFRCPVCSKEANFSEISDMVDIPQLRIDRKKIVVFDSISQMVNSCTAHISKGKADDYKFEYDDWAKLGKLMNMFLSEIQAAPFDIVCISHELEVEMVDGKKKIVPTAGTTNFSRNTAKFFDEVIYMQVVNKKHGAASATTWQNQIQTGSRSDFNIEALPVPSLLPLFEHRLVG